jgi:hypothetical protein
MTQYSGPFTLDELKTKKVIKLLPFGVKRWRIGMSAG